MYLENDDDYDDNNNYGGGDDANEFDRVSMKCANLICFNRGCDVVRLGFLTLLLWVCYPCVCACVCACVCVWFNY